MKKEETKTKSKSKKRLVIVLIFLILFAIYLFVAIRGEYLQTLEIGENFLSVFKNSIKYKVNVILINFVVLYIATYITTLFIKKGLKKFFDEEKKTMPKLPNKSISLIFSAIVSMIMGSLLTDKVMLALNATWFGKSDPVFGLDIGYYMFQKPLIETLIIYFIVLMVVYSIYIAVYYIITFNIFFDKGVDRQTLKKSLFFKHIITNVVLIAIAGAGLILVKTQDVVFSKFLTLSDGTSLYGAGTIEATVKTWGYRIFAIVVLICSIFAIHNFKKESFKKTGLWLCGIPAYLVVLFIVMIGTDLIYVNNNELDKEKPYIENNIEFTKNAYNINIDEVEIENSGTITNEDIVQNEESIGNINLINEEAVLSTLKQYKTNLGYYSYNTAQVGMYSIDGKKQLIYLAPREIVNNETRTYNNKTYEYTHGYGVVATSASSVGENGGLNYIQSEFDSSNNKINISEPRIYFGTQTNGYIITNAKNKTEFDYPLTSTTNSSNSYEGTAGLKLNFFDRLILGIKERNFKLAFAGNITKESKIITTRNIRERAKEILPNLLYDENPYMVATDDGNLVWVLDAYTISNDYPYSEQTIIEYEGMKQKINYIRNSVKVIIDAYNGTTKFYITDRTDPIIMAYYKMLPGLFEEEAIPESISNHIVYSQYLYDIQASILEKYHKVQAEVLYRADDVWDIARENTNKTNSGTATGTPMKSYYTTVKTIDSEETKLSLVVPYTNLNKQNLVSYLVGTYNNDNTQKLTMYKFKSANAILGTNQLDTLVEQDEQIAKEVESVNVSGTKVSKNIMVVPINNTLLYVEPIYQTMLNETIQVPVLKKVIVASGNKIAIGNNLEQALTNLLSKNAVSVEVDSENKEELINQIINANKNLTESNKSNNWELIGKDMTKLQELITQLETTVEAENKNNEKDKTTNITKVQNNVINTNNNI